ncbi:MAG: adenosine-specific kinase [bacterium]
MEIKTVDIAIPEGCNVIAGQAHFIKTVEDLYEIISSSVPGVRFGIAFCEASQERLVRFEGNDDALTKAAIDAVLSVGAGHFFLIFIKNAFPINLLPMIKICQEVCTIFCSTANPVKLVVAEEGEQRAVLGVMDGFTPLGVEKDEHKRVRKEFLRKIGYKLSI